MSRNSRRSAARFEASSSFHSNSGDSPEQGAGHRQARLEHLLLDEIQSLIREEASDPALEGITLLSVHLSPDGGHARLAYAVVAAPSQERQVAEQAKAALVRATGFLRARVAQHLNLKKLPKLSFTFIGVVEGGSGAGSGGDPCPE